MEKVVQIVMKKVMIFVDFRNRQETRSTMPMEKDVQTGMSVSSSQENHHYYYHHHYRYYLVTVVYNETNDMMEVD